MKKRCYECDGDGCNNCTPALFDANELWDRFSESYEIIECDSREHRALMPQRQFHKAVQAIAAALAEREGQREEGICDDCRRPYPVWFAPNPVWNRVIPSTQGMLCPICFIARAEKAGIECTGWELRPENYVAEPSPQPVQPKSERSNTMEYEVAQDKNSSNDWRVEAINFAGDGEIYLSIFYGHDAELRAREYAAFKQSQPASAEGSDEK